MDGTDVLAVLDSGGLRLLDLETCKRTIPPVEMWTRTVHFATVRVWNPRTGCNVTELRLGTRVDGIGVRNTADGRLLIAVSGPGLVLAEL